MTTGRTPHAAILSQKLERVASLLRDSSSSIELIAARCGFDHPEYLQVAFRKHFGTTPGLYRKTKGRSIPNRAGIDLQ
jgi:LacI family transcriptional regulator